VVKQLINRPVAKLSVLFSGFGSPENRRHARARIKWPVVMTTSNGLVDGQTHNVSLGGAFIRCQEKPDLEDNFRLVMSTKDRLGRKSEGKSAYHEMGIRFTKISGNDRTFLSGVISNHT